MTRVMRANRKIGQNFAITVEQLERLNIGKRYWPSMIHSIPQSTHRSLLEHYCLTMDDSYAVGSGLFLWGKNGVGKTYAATAILKFAVIRGFSSYCVLADTLRTAYIDREMFDPEMTITKRVETVDFLLVEDLGKEYSGRGSNWAEMCFENMLRKRNRENLPTIITSNLTPEEFKKRYEESAMSLVLGTMDWVEVVDVDYREFEIKESPVAAFITHQHGGAE